jgi:glucose-6-phosphate 1-dehydrogenase
MLLMRFANPIFGAWWNRHYISNVQISFKEDFGTQVGMHPNMNRALRRVPRRHQRQRL